MVRVERRETTRGAERASDLMESMLGIGVSYEDD